MEPKWLDAPFFNLLEDFASLQTYFLAQALFIAKIVITLNIGFMALKYAIKGEGFKEPVVKLMTSLILFLIIINSYPLMIRGLNRVIYDWSYGSTYGKVAEMIQKTTDSGETSEFWAKKANDPDAYSDIIKVLVEKTGSGNIAKKYVLDIFDKGSDNRPGMFIRPNAVMRLLMLTFENIWNRVLLCLSSDGSGIIPFPRDLGGAIILTLTGIAVLLGGIFASMQYFIGAIEFTLITSVGCLLLPFMLWDGTKFLTEKLVGAIIGQALKLLFVTLAFMLTINGFLALMVREFDGHIDQAIYTIFTVFFYWMLCQHGPGLATALLTGTPQLSMAEGLQTAGSMAGAAVAGAAGLKAITSGAAKTGVQTKSTINKAQGAANAAKESGKSQVSAAMGSLTGSAKDSVKSGMHGLAQSLTRGKGSAGQGRSGGSSSGGSGPTNGLNNRYSTLERRNASNENGNRKTGKEFGSESKQMGYERYMDNQQIKSETANQKAAADWKAQIQNKPKAEEGPKQYDGGTPLGQSAPQRNTGEEK